MIVVFVVLSRSFSINVIVSGKQTWEDKKGNHIITFEEWTEVEGNTSTFPTELSQSNFDVI